MIENIIDYYITNDIDDVGKFESYIFNHFIDKDNSTIIIYLNNLLHFKEKKLNQHLSQYFHDLPAKVRYEYRNDLKKAENFFKGEYDIEVNEFDEFNEFNENNEYAHIYYEAYSMIKELAIINSLIVKHQKMQSGNKNSVNENIETICKLFIDYFDERSLELFKKFLCNDTLENTDKIIWKNKKKNLVALLFDLLKKNYITQQRFDEYKSLFRYWNTKEKKYIILKWEQKTHSELNNDILKISTDHDIKNLLNQILPITISN